MIHPERETAARGAFAFLPGPDFVVKNGDVLVAIGLKADLRRIAGA